MDVSTALAADLAALTESLDEPGTDISRTLRQLVADARLAVRSCLGLSVVLPLGGRRTAFTVLEERARPEDIRASLRISFPPRLSGSDDPAAAAFLILFAARPGAFLGLATDLSWLTGSLGGGVFVLDEDLTVPPDPAAPSGLKALSTTDQAIGALIGQGNTPEQAHQHLEQLAADTHVDLPTAAGTILGELDRPRTTGLRADDGHPAPTRGPGRVCECRRGR